MGGKAASGRDEIRKKIAEGAESLRNGEGVDSEEVFQHLERELDKLERNRPYRRAGSSPPSP